MGFDAITQPATAGPTVAADLDACLTHARANASDGDEYHDSSTGLFYVYRAVGSGVLIPAQALDFYSAPLALNASGDCYISSADTLANLLARGWSEVYGAGSGFITKTAGNPLVVEAPTTSWSSSMFRFEPSTPFVAADKFLIVAKIASVLSAATLYGTMWITQQAKTMRVGIGVGTVEGDYSFLSGSGEIGAGNSSVGTDPTWIAFSFPATDPARITILDDPEQTEYVEYSSFAATTASTCDALAYTYGSTRTKFEITELFLFVVV